MVWFQCDDCGDNLKKPKLPHHFKFCSASRLSCIDCGKVFRQQDVENHTQCITEAEKYGPKGQVKDSNGTNAKTKDDSKQKPDVDVNVGLSERPPWFCSLCKSSATSKQTLLQHADGKKHRGKARAFHAANQQPNATAETVDNKQSNANVETKSNNQPDATVETKDKKQPNTTLETMDNTENKVKNGVSDGKDMVESRNVSSSKVGASRLEGMVEVNASKLKKKRKHKASENGALDKTAGGAEAGDDETIQINGEKTEGTKGSKKAKCRETEDDGELNSTAKEVHKKEIKWKKLISSALRSNPEGLLKFKKLTEVVLESLKRSGYTVERSQVSETLKHNITSSSRFTLEGKHVRLSPGIG